jgi:HEPN domain-containing protein
MSANLHQPWLDRAEADLIVARLVLVEGHYAHACFFSQQCLEKATKAYLLNQSGKYPRTHRLVDLITECVNFEPSFSKYQANCVVVDQYYIPTRYPDAVSESLLGGLPNEVEAREAVDIAEVVFKFVKSLLP